MIKKISRSITVFVLSFLFASLLSSCGNSTVISNSENVKHHWFKLPFDNFSFWGTYRQHCNLQYDVSNPVIQKQIHWYQRHPRHTEKMLAEAGPYFQYVFEEICHKNLPAELALIPLIESEYNPTAHARSGASGLWQIMPNTAHVFGLSINHWYDGRRDIIASTHTALNYLSYLHGYFNNQWLLAIAAYDVGEKRVKSALQKHHMKDSDFWHLHLPHETRVYIPKLLALTTIIKNPEQYGITLPKINKNLYFVTMKVHEPIDLQRLAQLSGVDNNTFKKLNPGFLHNKTRGSQTLLVPTANYVTIQNNLSEAKTELSENEDTNDSVPTKKHTYKVTTKKHKIYMVHRGDTLSRIAKKYHVATKNLKKSNHITNTKHLKPGQKIAIPT